MVTQWDQCCWILSCFSLQNSAWAAQSGDHQLGGGRYPRRGQGPPPQPKTWTTRPARPWSQGSPATSWAQAFAGKIISYFTPIPSFGEGEVPGEELDCHLGCLENGLTFSLILHFSLSPRNVTLVRFYFFSKSCFHRKRLHLYQATEERAQNSMSAHQGPWEEGRWCLFP